MTGISLRLRFGTGSTSSIPALRSGSPSGATRSSTWYAVIDLHGRSISASRASIARGVLPPLNATAAAPRAATASLKRRAMRRAVYADAASGVASTWMSIGCSLANRRVEPGSPRQRPT